MDKVAESHMATRFALAMAQIGQPMAQTGALSLQNSCYILSKNLEMSLVFWFDIDLAELAVDDRVRVLTWCAFCLET